MKKNVFITGGSGYIGSEFVVQCKKLDYKITVFDNLEYGFKNNISDDIKLIVGDLRDFRSIQTALFDEKPDIVVHFAAYAFVGESMNNPLKYYYNNIVGGLNLLTAMEQCNCKRIIFSSTCATYGNPEQLPITENTPQNPINPYGESKLIMERIIKSLHNLKGLRYTIFRYFNACGADLKNNLYERHNPEPHIIPNILKSIKNNTTFNLYGNNYNTEDGSCIRDYINIKDLASAHVIAIQKDICGEFNLGTNGGISNIQLIKESEKITGKKCQVNTCEKRNGDPDKLIADSTRAQKTLDWYPEYSNISCILTEAWKGLNNAN